jgi:non-heme chloroperoxidase
MPLQHYLAGNRYRRGCDLTSSGRERDIEALAVSDSKKEEIMDRRSVVKSAVAGAGAVMMAAGGEAVSVRSAQSAALSPGAEGGSWLQTRDGASLFYNDWGSGKPVVFSHAWGLNADIWEYQLTELSDQGLRCIAYDRRGHGRSSDPGRGYDYDTLADDLAALIERLDLTEVTLVGFSMGSGEVARYLSRHGAERIARIMLVSAVRPKPDGALFPGFIAALKQDRPAFFAAGVPLFLGSRSAVSPAMSQWVLTQFLRASPKAIIECMRAISSSDLHADLAAIKLPTLVIHGGNDQVNPLDTTGKLTAQAIPGAEFRVYEDAPHGLVITHRDRLTGDLMAFVRS